MKFQKGHPKPPNSGRKKGVGNKKKVLKVQEILTAQDLNPVEKVIQLIPFLEEREQVKVWMELQSYCEAKPKETDESPPPDGSSELEDIPTAELLKLVPKPDGAS